MLNYPSRALVALALLALAALACNLPGGGGATSAPDFPSVTITAPENGARVLIGQDLEVQSQSTHPNGVARVELWVDGAQYRIDTSPSPAQKTFGVTQRWQASAPGAHTLEVRVFGSSPIAAAAAQVMVLAVDSPAQLTVTPGPGETRGPTPAGTGTLTPTPTATGTPTGTPTPTTAAPVGGMVFVPAGPFTMGSDAAEDEQPVHSVTLSGFYIDQYEVTTAQFKAFVAAGGYRTTAEQRGDANNWRQFDAADRQNQPVRWMSWDDAHAYCGWAGKRLPSEAEWEKAARGTDARKYPWGNSFNKALVPHGDAANVGSFANAGPYGAYDMAGNAWEWVADWYDAGYYAITNNAVDPRGPAGGVARILRGGGYNNDQNDLRTTRRLPGGQDGYSPDHGFRCAK